jgi:plastocyanin
MRPSRPFAIVLLAGSLLSGCGEKSGTPAPGPKPEAPWMKIDAATAGGIQGEVRFAGQAPKAEPIDMSQDPACILGDVPPNHSQAYEVAQGKLANVYVYIKEGPVVGGRFAAPAEPVVLDQRGCRYVPHVTALMTGQTLRILNSDPAMHNVNAQTRQDPWNLSQAPKGAAIEKRYLQPEVMAPFKCNQHPWMRAYVNVSSHPFFAVTGTDGRFTIAGLPPGEYTLAAVHEKLGERTMHVTVGAKETKDVGFEFAGK